MSIRSAGPAAVPTAEELESWQKRWTRANAERDQALDELAQSRAKVATLREEIVDIKRQNQELNKLVSARGQVPA